MNKLLGQNYIALIFYMLLTNIIYNQFRFLLSDTINNYSFLGKFRTNQRCLSNIQFTEGHFKTKLIVLKKNSGNTVNLPKKLRY